MNNNENQFNQNHSIIDVNENDFTEQVIEASENKIILADFWAPWCGPCKQLSPILEEIIKESQGTLTLVKINIDENQQLAAQLRIQSIPTVMAFYKKKIVNAFQGVLPKQKIIKFIEKISGEPIKKDNSEFYKTIDHLISNNKPDQAIDLLDEFLTENSNDTVAISLYIKCLAELKKFSELDDFIKSLSENIVLDKKIQFEITNFKFLRKVSSDTSFEKLLGIYKNSPNDIKNIIKLSDKYFVEKKTEEAFDLLFDNFLKFKDKNKEKIKNTILKYFGILGNEHEKTKIYRRKLSSIIFS